MDQLSDRYLEDFAVEQTFGSGRLRIDGARTTAPPIPITIKKPRR